MFDSLVLCNLPFEPNLVGALVELFNTSVLELSLIGGWRVVSKGGPREIKTYLLHCEAVCWAKPLNVVCIITQCVKLVGLKVKRFEGSTLIGFGSTVGWLGSLRSRGRLLGYCSFTAITGGSLSWQRFRLVLRTHFVGITTKLTAEFLCL